MTDIGAFEFSPNLRNVQQTRADSWSTRAWSTRELELHDCY